MSPRLRNRRLRGKDPTNLSVFPMDQKTAQRLARSLDPEELTQSRFEKGAIIVLLLEAFVRDLESMESQALNLSSPPAKLLAEIITMQKGVVELNRILENDFREPD